MNGLYIVYFSILTLGVSGFIYYNYLDANSAAKAGYSDIIIFSDFLSLVVFNFFGSLLGMNNVDQSNNNSFLRFLTPYECGYSCVMVNVSNFSMSFLLLLVFFVILDVEIVLLLNCVIMEEAFDNLFLYLIFLLIVLFSFLFEIWNGFIGFNY